MTAKEYLLQAQRIDREIARRTERIKVLRSMATRLTRRLKSVHVQASPNPAATQAFLDEAADEETEVRRLQELRRRLQAEITFTISRLEDPAMARLLECRYLEGFSWMEIADELRCSDSAVFRIHRDALELLPVPPEEKGLP